MNTLTDIQHLILTRLDLDAHITFEENPWSRRGDGGYYMTDTAEPLGKRTVDGLMKRAWVKPCRRENGIVREMVITSRGRNALKEFNHARMA